MGQSPYCRRDERRQAFRLRLRQVLADGIAHARIPEPLQVPRNLLPRKFRVGICRKEFANLVGHLDEVRDVHVRRNQ